MMCLTSRHLCPLLSHGTGSPNGHSPVLNLSKSGGLDQGSTGDQSDRSDGGHSPAPSLIRDEEEHDLSDDNVSEVDEREEKDDGMCCVIEDTCFPVP